MRYFNKKDPGETITLTFDFTKDLLTGETLTGVPAVSISLYSGSIDANMTAMLTASPVISGNMVLQSCTNGIVGSIYDVKAACTTSSGRTLIIGGLLPIIDAALH